MIYYETDYLAHHGVKGMKWGRRKQRVLKGRSRRQLATEYRAKNAERVKAYSKSKTARTNKRRTYASAAIGVGTGAAVTLALNKVARMPLSASGTIGAFTAFGSGYVARKIMRNKKR